MTTITIDPCLDEYMGDCEGEVEYRIPMSPTGKSFPRCEKHFSERLDTQERISKDYGVPMFYEMGPEDY
jgi:hypothetical protein